MVRAPNDKILESNNIRQTSSDLGIDAQFEKPCSISGHIYRLTISYKHSIHWELDPGLLVILITYVFNELPIITYQLLVDTSVARASLIKGFPWGMVNGLRKVDNLDLKVVWWVSKYSLYSMAFHNIACMQA